MHIPECKEILIDIEQSVLYLTLNRPQKRNAMNSAMVTEIALVIDEIAKDNSVRALVLRGAGGHFCAGGDISGMNVTAENKKQASWEFNRSFGYLISKINHAPQIVICMLEGAVLGGGFGLACVSDLAIAHADAKFSMPETGLGIIPAQIAPFVVARIGLTQARRLALLGEIIDGCAAKELGIVHHQYASTKEMDDKLLDVLKLIKACAPNATAVTKQLLLDSVNPISIDDLLDRAADDFSAALISQEGQEGTQAFIQKRKPNWSE